MIVVFVLLCFLRDIVSTTITAIVTSNATNLPTAANYQNVYAMEQQEKIPWPSFRPSSKYRALTNQQLAALGQQYFSAAPASQNKTCMALCIYDWSMPDYRRPQFYLTSRGNITTLGNFITLNAPNLPNVPAIFGLIQGTPSYVLQQLQAQYSRVIDWCTGETEVLHYAVQQLPSKQYTSFGAPKVLYRGDGRDVVYYCNQFSSVYGLTIDQCVSQYFTTNSVIEVRPFWSTSPDKSVVSHFTGRVIYNILPNLTARSGWAGKNINDFSVAVFQNEYLYPADSRFQVMGTSCIYNSATARYIWNITLMELDPFLNHRNWLNDALNPLPFASNRTVVKCVDN